MLKKTEKQGQEIVTKVKWGWHYQTSKGNKKKVKFTPSTSLREGLARIKSYRDSRKKQTGTGLTGDLAKIGLNLGSQALNSNTEKKQKKQRD